MRPFHVLLAVFALLLSGCAATSGTPDQAPQAPGNDVAAGGDTREDAASLNGLVLDDSQAPIVGAVAGLLELNLTATTDQGGAFRFTNLPPGPLTLSAAALGFQAQSKRVTLEANQEAHVSLELVAIRLSVAHHQIFGPFPGFFSCKMGTPVQSSACGSVLLTSDVSFRTDDILWANDKAFQWFNLTDPDYRSIIGELDWAQGTFATSTKLRSSFDHERFGSHWFCGQEGKSPLFYRFERSMPDNTTTCMGNSASATAKPTQPYWNKPLVTGFRVPFGSTSTTDPSPVYLAVQQKVTSYMSVFYGEPAPDGWSTRPDH